MMPEDNSKPKKGFFAKKKGLKIAGIALLLVLVLGGGVAALVVQSIKNQPQNVAAKSISNYLFGLKDGGKSKITFKFNSDSVKSGEAVLELATAKGLAAGQGNINFKVDGNQLGGSVQVAENGNLYVKVNNLASMLGSFTGDSSALTEEQKSVISSLNEKWVEITADDIKSLGGDKFSQENECTTALSSAVMGDELGSLVDRTYTSNRFMTANSSSVEELDGRKVLKVEVGLDEETARKFGEKLGKSNLIQNIFDKCKDELSSLDSSSESSSGGFKNGKLTIWADRGKKQLVKLEASGETSEGDQKNSSFSLIVEPGKGDVEIENIGDDNKINIKDLLSAFGVDEGMLRSLVRQGESEL